MITCSRANTDHCPVDTVRTRHQDKPGKMPRPQYNTRKRFQGATNFVSTIYAHEHHDKNFFVRHYLHQQEADNEGAALAVADLPVVDAVGLHHVEQRLLAHAALLLEEVVLGVGAGDVAPDHLLARALGPQQRRVARLVLGGVRPAQNLQSGGRVLALHS